MLKHVPTLLVVTAVALAIWIVAEAESIRSDTFTHVVPIDSTARDGYIARADPARVWPGRFTITAEGSAGALDALRRALESGILLAPGRGLRPEPGLATVNLRDAIASLQEIDATGATIASVEPPEVSVEVAELETRTIPLELDRAGLSLDTDPVLRPDRVQITGPRKFIDALPVDARAVARLRPEDLQRLLLGQPQTITGVRVELPPQIPQAEFWGPSPLNPPAIEVTLVLRAQVRSYTIASVPVLLAVAPVDFNDWDVTADGGSRFLTNVVLTGPSDIIGQFERGERRVDAFVRLSFQDLTQGVTAGTITRQAIIGPLPPGVTSHCDEDQVELTVRLRPTTQPTEPDEGPAASPES